MPTNKRIAIITGISGQDGAFLASLLLQNGYHVIGLTRKANPILFKNLAYLGVEKLVEIVETDLAHYKACERALSRHAPHELYNLAAQSSVSESFKKPLETIRFNVTSVLNLLEAIRNVNPLIRFYQASSSEMFGSVNQLPITIHSVLHPVSPYGISKATGHWLVSQYRESYGLYAVSGVLFNHESFLRLESFFVKKIISGAVRISNGLQRDLHVGSLDIKRDFGSAMDYVKAIWLMMGNVEPRDYLVCSGTSISLREILYYVFDVLKVNKDRIIEDASLKRPTEILDIYGDSLPIRNELGWQGEVDFYKVLDKMIAEEIKHTNSNGR